jgi:DnaJ-class molecular chaperone
MQTAELIEREAQCDSPCYDTNKFAPGNYKVTCPDCRGRRGRFNREDQWYECQNCQGTGSVRCPRCLGSGKIISAD